MLMLFLAGIAVGVGVALFNWRRGIEAAILLSLLQDPVRKLVPGAPAWLVLAAVPVWLAVLVSAARARQLPVSGFLRMFPRLGGWLKAFAAYLVIPAAISATYGRNSWMITLLGAFVYATVFLMMVAGWRYPRPPAPPVRFLAFYAVAGALMLLGGPLEAMGLQAGHPVIGTEALGHVWVTYRTGAPVHMLSGLFRSPDVMGWHAALVFMVASILALRSKGRMRWIWIGVAVWGLLNIWLCGRRKMLAMVPVFAGGLVLMEFRARNLRRILSLAGTALLIGGLGWYLIASLYRSAAVERFYLSTIEEANERIEFHGIRSVFSTVKQAGFWGYGLGMSQQGVHNIRAEKPRLWQESGPSKLVAELGVPGVALLLGLGTVLLLTMIHVVRRGRSGTGFVLSAGILSILLANGAASVVSAQIFGDPLVAFLLAFLAGLLLADARIPLPGEVAAPPCATGADPVQCEPS